MIPTTLTHIGISRPLITTSHLNIRRSTCRTATSAKMTIAMVVNGFTNGPSAVQLRVWNGTPTWKESPGRRDDSAKSIRHHRLARARPVAGAHARRRVADRKAPVGRQHKRAGRTEPFDLPDSPVQFLQHQPGRRRGARARRHAVRDLFGHRDPDDALAQ